MMKFPSPRTTGFEWCLQNDFTLPSTEESSIPPLISIIVPNYNGDAFLESCLRSVILQRGSDVELIVVDGGSTDDSLSIIERYQPWIDVIISEEDEGQTHAIVKGLLRAQGTWVGFLNSDDFYEAGAFEFLRSKLSDQSIKWLSSGVSVISEAGEKFRVRRAEIGTNGSIGWITYVNTLPQPGCFWRRELHETVGFPDKSYHYALDTEFWFRLHSKDIPLEICHQITANFRVHGAAKSSIAGPKFIEEHFRMLAENERNFSEEEVRFARKLLSKMHAERLVYKTADDKTQPTAPDLLKALTLSPEVLLWRPFWGALKKRMLG